jgi:hypothetical protein
MNLLHHLRELIRQRNAETFALELSLDPSLTRKWFDEGFTHEGYGAEVIKALGSHVLDRMILLTSGHGGNSGG